MRTGCGSTGLVRKPPRSVALASALVVTVVLALLALVLDLVHRRLVTRRLVLVALGIVLVAVVLGRHVPVLLLLLRIVRGVRALGDAVRGLGRRQPRRQHFVGDA